MRQALNQSASQENQNKKNDNSYSIFDCGILAHAYYLIYGKRLPITHNKKRTCWHGHHVLAFPCVLAGYGILLDKRIF